MNNEQKVSWFGHACVVAWTVLMAAKLVSLVTGAFALSWWVVFAPLIASWLRVFVVLVWRDLSENQ